MISKHESGRQEKKATTNGNGLKARPKTVKKTRGYQIPRYFTRPEVHPFDALEWELRTAAITGETGKVYFEQKDVEVPKGWSATATNVVVQKYFRGKLGTPQRERSVKQLVGRVADTITNWGRKDQYFASEVDAENFRAELTHLLVNQMMAFNSPVWFNVGVEEHPQCSACFINSVEDSMESILGLAKTEGMLFKYGSGTGSNLSCLRSSKEHLNGGGTASGPVSFMRGFDAFAGVIKSGGKTRRAAKMVILNVDHPDIVDFIDCKATEERKAWALIDAGYEGGFNVPGGAYDSVFYQNANHSVRVTDDFMEAVLKDREWNTRSVVGRQTVGTYRARDLMRKISDAAHQCGDPGLQFDTTVNAWHTSPRSGRINASNPCSEYMYLDDSACNLASLNLRKFQKPGAAGSMDGELDVEAVKKAIETTILAMEIIVGNSKYPTDRIAQNSHKYRPLGLGYANLGALLMSRGLPYDSEPARAYAAAVTALLCGEAYATSAKIARDSTGPFDGYEPNREPFLHVMEKHRRACDGIDQAYVPHDLIEAARHSWDDALMVGREFGFRNGQATVLAPTGTIGFMMDCDTTGIEPDIALVKYKRLVGGGTLKIVNGTVPEALAKLGYADEQIKKIIDYIDENETIEGAPGLKDEHLPVFDCAFRAANGTRSIHYMGHIRMMSATQPFLSGAISKTVNLPTDCTVEDIENAYLEAWKLGLKAIAVYRDGCKRTQPLSTGSKKEEVKTGAPTAVRRKLSDERQSITHKFSVAGHEGYITVGLYEDGSPGEIFIRMAKEGSTMSGLMDSFATAISLSLQHGVPLRLLVDKFARTRFEPSGFTGNPDVPRATSIMDYIFRWLALKFLGEVQNPALLAQQAEKKEEVAAAPAPAAKIEVVEASHKNGNGKSLLAGIVSELDAPMCRTCGTKMVRNGACHKCPNCGDTDGCS